MLPCLVDFIVNDFAPSGILAWLRAWLYRGAQTIDILLIFSSLDGASSVRLKSCCAAAPRLLIYFIDIIFPRWQQQRVPEVMLYRSAQAIDIFLPRWH